MSECYEHEKLRVMGSPCPYCRIAELEGAIGDVYQCWLRDGNSATWGGVLPRLFEALGGDDE